MYQRREAGYLASQILAAIGAKRTSTHRVNFFHGFFMLIKNVAVSLPSRIVTNEEVIDMIRFHSKEYEGDIDRGMRTIKTLLDRSGLVNRRWCESHESPIDHVAMATRKALSETYLKPEHIELFIYVGIGRGFLEP
jgi:3-oxoacyl-[acyl-carrier-protein] synthase III